LIILGRKRDSTSSLRINERQAALTSHNYCDNKIAPVTRYQLDLDGFCFASRRKPSRAKHCRGDGRKFARSAADHVSGFPPLRVADEPGWDTIEPCIVAPKIKCSHCLNQ
jgi:hypothetical protein